MFSLSTIIDGVEAQGVLIYPFDRVDNMHSDAVAHMSTLGFGKHPLLL